MINQTSVSEFLDFAGTIEVIDVRSEKEYLQGHIPGAFNLPLFNNEERAVVGTLYKNSGREASVLKGLEFAGPKLADFVKQAHRFTDQKKLLMYCWRGGMRSESMAWLFQVAGYEVSVMKNGYKAYRHFIREGLSQPANIIILGGLTGSGKTQLLHLLGKMGEQVLDIENLACHKGFVFRGFGQPRQPTNEQFENDIYNSWRRFNHSGLLWIEDESRMIGNVSIPDPLFEQMNRAVMIKVESDKEYRVQRLVEEYSKVQFCDLQSAIMKISEKLGGANTQKALTAIEKGDYETVASLALTYYDKTYEHSVLKRKNQKILKVFLKNHDPVKNAELILETSKSIK